MGNFRNEIEERLQGLSHKQICQFAWLCGVRALPFLSAKRAFVYWKENKRQEHLWSIFNALDICAAFTYEHGPPAADYAAAADAAADAADAARAADYAAADYANAYADYADYADYAAAADAARAARAARAAARAAYAARAAAAAYASDSASDYASDYAAADYAVNAAAAYDDRAAVNDILYADIEAIKTNNLATLNNDTSIYGEVWQNFLDDLNSIGCGYWAKLYEDLFKNKFVIDVAELERRLGVPDEIKAQGAAAVGQYLEAQNDNVKLLRETSNKIEHERMNANNLPNSKPRISEINKHHFPFLFITANDNEKEAFGKVFLREGTNYMGSVFHLVAFHAA